MFLSICLPLTLHRPPPCPTLSLPLSKTNPWVRIKKKKKERETLPLTYFIKNGKNAEKLDNSYNAGVRCKMVSIPRKTVWQF